MGVGSTVCQVCGSANVQPAPKAAQEARCLHGDLVRSVALGEDFVLSGSYDLSIKVCWEISPSSGMGIFDIDIDSFQVWDRKTGALVADLTGGHTGRIFCIGFDSTKVRDRFRYTPPVRNSPYLYRSDRSFHAAKTR